VLKSGWYSPKISQPTKMKKLWNYSIYGNDLKLTRNDAEKCSHSGDCQNDVLEVMKKPYVTKQLKAINHTQLRKELKEYGAWSESELHNLENNLMRWVWISAADIIERLHEDN